MLLATSILLQVPATLAQAPCNFLTKAAAEAFLSQSIVERRNSETDCWYVQEGFAGGTGANDKQIRLTIWRSASPDAEAVKTRRASIAADRTMNGMVSKDVANFADAAMWNWTPRWGRFGAFKAGVIEVEVIVAGIEEDAALRSAKTVAALALGGLSKSGFAYNGTAAGSAKQVQAGTGPAPAGAQSPASYRDAWMGQNKVVRGTVARVSVNFKSSPRWLTIFFRESPDAAFVICSPYPDLVEDAAGDLSSLVGKTVEVTGQVEGSKCSDKAAASIWVVSSEQFHVQAAAEDRAGASEPEPGLPRREGARVGLDIGNAGKAEFDAFVVKQGRVANTHIVPRRCAHFYEESGAAAYVGFAFADSHGQWGAPRRLDLLPNDFGSSNAPGRVWSNAEQSISVKRGPRMFHC